MDSHGKKNVLIIVENLPLPFDRRVWQEANTLADAGFGVFIICPKGKDKYTEDFEEISGIKIFRHNLPLEANGPIGYLAEYSSALYWEKKLTKKIHREYGIDVIQACNPPDLIHLVVRSFKRRYGIKFIFDHHDINPELYLAKFGKKDFFYKLLLYFEKRTFKMADHCIATNESYKKIAVERGGKDEQDITVVRSGPSLERMYPVDRNESLKNGKKFLICYVGVIGQQEGIHYLLNAAKILKEVRGNDTHFIIMGSGPEMENMRELSQKLKIDSVVDFPGRVSDEYLRQALSTSDICVNPDEYNEMNDKSTMNKVMEYMAVGKPIVQFDLKEGRFSAGESSLYALPNDSKDMADKISFLLDNEEKRKYMGDYGIKRVREELEWEYERGKYLSVYSDLLKVTINQNNQR